MVNIFILVLISQSIMFWSGSFSNEVIKNGLIAYDCTAPEVNISTYSLRQVDPCIISQQNVETTEENIVVLQKSEKVRTKVMQCRMIIHRRIQHCGMHSHTSEVENSYAYLVQNFSPIDCSEAIYKGRVHLYNHIYISELKPNTTMRGEKLVTGSVTKDRCNGGVYATSDNHWEDVLVFYRYELTLMEYWTEANVEANTIKLRNGLDCTYTQMSCLDSEEGYSFWEMDSKQSCEDKDYEVIYSGRANKTVVKSDNSYNIGPLYTTNVLTNMFTIKSKSKTNICGYTGYSTDHNRIFIIELQSNFHPFSRKVNEGINLDLLTYFNSKIAFLEHHTQEQFSNLYTHIMNEMCNLERSLLETHLILARINPNEFASKLTKKPGNTAVISGEVIHVINCVPVYVLPNPSNRCYQEIPVLHNGVQKYVAPVTRIIQRKGTEINCAPLLEAKYQFGSKWYTIESKLRETTSPLILGSNIKSDWTYTSLGDIISSGLYDNSSLEKMKSLIYEQSDRRTVSNVVHRIVSGDHPNKQGINISNLLEEAEITSRMKKIWEDIMFWTSMIANVASSTFGMYIIFKGIKFIVDTAVHCKILHDIYGLSWKLLAAIWDSLTALLEHNHMKKKNQSNEVPLKDIPHEEILVATTLNDPSPPYDNENNQELEAVTATAPIYPSLETSRNSRGYKNQSLKHTRK